MFKKSFIISSLIAFSGLSAQTHTVVKGDTPYNISKKYGLSLDELYQKNPKVKDGKLALGEVLVVGKTAGSTKTAASKTTAASTQLGKIVLQPKQTIYGITKQYRISEAELRRLNPELDSHMKIGEEVVLPLENINKFGAGQAVAVKPEEVKTVPAAEEVKKVEKVASEDL